MTGDAHRSTGVHAVDAIQDADERRRFEQHLLSCPDCAQEVRELRETAAALAEAVAAPPPAGLRPRVMARIAATPQLPPEPRPATSGLPARSGPVTTGSAGTGPPPLRARPRRDRRPRRTRPLVVIAASVAVLVGGGLSAVGVVQQHRAQQSEQQAQRVLAVVADPAARRVTGRVTGGGTATLVAAGDRAALVTAGMPALADDRTYQLWVVRPGRTVSAGLGPRGRSAAGRWTRLIEGIRSGDAVAISVEPSGGSGQPTTVPVTLLEPRA